MTDYSAAVGQTAAVYRDDIEADLALAIDKLQRSQAVVTEDKERVQRYRMLLALADAARAGKDEPPSEKLTLHKAMHQVLTDAPAGMMRAAHLAAAIQEQGLYRMRDGRPVEAQQIHARVGQYPHEFEREGTFIKLRSVT